MVVTREPNEATVGRVRAAAKSWRASLINISGANPLLYYRTLRVGTLLLDDAHPAALADLFAGKTVRLQRLFPEPTRSQSAAKSLKAITTRARVAAEEFGVHLTHVATGFATWPTQGEGVGGASETDPAASTGLRAPVLLRPVNVIARPGSVNGFELALTGEAQVNPILLHLLHAQFGIDVDDVGLLERALDDAALFDALTRHCQPDLPGFTVSHEAVLANFTYAEQPLVDDLADDAAAFLAANDLVAALAGDDAAAERARAAGQPVDVDAPDRKPPSDEYLVLDADGSQSYVVNAVIGGQNLVVQGPPGTGKSQTIANVIAELVAKNKRVLFVAQKRAAIEAVLDRLERVGLGHLVLDLFATSSSRKAVVAAVSTALDTSRAARRPQVEALHRRLAESRDLLVAARDAMHEVRQPWGIALSGTPEREGATSAWGLYDWAVGTRESEPRGVRLDLAALQRWDTGTHEHLRGVVEDFVATGGADRELGDPGWSWTALRTPEWVVAADQTLVGLLEQAEQLQRTCARLAAASGLPLPVTLDDAGQMLAYAADAQRVYDLRAARAFEASLSMEELGRQVAAVGGKGLRKQVQEHLGFFERRRVAGQTRATYPEAPNLGETLWLALRTRAVFERVAGRPPTPPYIDAAPGLELHALVTASIGAARPYLQGLNLQALDLSQLVATLRSLTVDVRHHRYPRLHQLEDMLVGSGCGAILDDLRRDPPADPADASARLSHAFAMTVIDHVHRTDRRLFGVDAQVRDRATHEFAARDIEARAANVARVARIHAEALANAVNTHPQEAEVVRNQLRRKRGYKPVRALLTEAPNVLLAAKPVWAASPQTVSELLPHEALFDVVIFDEASQIQPAAALPAIARGRQVVVAGDSLQLPPTTLFTRTVVGPESDDDGQEEDNDDGSTTGIVVRDMESILDAVETKLGPQRSRHLAWHYRSRDERLIATSNTWVYRPVGRTMTTFPAADGQRALTHIALPASTGIGPNNLSPAAEVDQVVELVLEHARADADAEPDARRTLGVIAFGRKHAERLTTELERRLVAEPEAVRGWFDPAAPEAFFIKNIERVQGDERAKIIISVGYTRGNDGKLRYAWGPVQQEGGHRRVNVAISRARSELILVTSFAAEDVDERASAAEGFHLMRRFINFASTAGADFGDAGPSDTPLNPFEYDILRRLQAAGLDVTPQYGVGSYRLDFAVRHPARPGEFVLAVEADGAAYHSGVVARERDRLRQQALEARGWSFVRIWSTDYFRDPEQQIARVVDAYRAVLDGQPSAPKPARTAALPAAPARPARGPRPRVEDGLPIGAYSDEDLEDMVRWVCSDDLVRTHDEIYDLVKYELGFQRNGKNIQERISAAVRRVNP